MNKIKPCQKCGSYDVGVKDSYGTLFSNKIKTWAYCRRCGFRGPVVILQDSIDLDQLDLEIEAAMEAWNRRADK